MKPLVAALGLAIAAAACDKAPLLAPTSSTITVSAPTRVLPLGGTTEITAVIVEQAGTPVQNGTTVRFTTSLGSVDPAEAQTRNGTATTTFSAGTNSGVAQIRATSGAAGSGSGDAATGGSNVVEIQIGAAAAANVLVSASPSTVSPTGGTVTIVASAVDANGNRLTGVPVSFSTTAGTLSASTATTDDSGEARVQLTTTAAATVTARVGNQSGTAAVALAPATTVTLAVSPTTPIAGQPLTLTLSAVAGTPRVTVDWGDGTTQDLGVVASTGRSVTHTYSSPGSYVITVTATGQAGDTFSTATSVIVAPRPAPTFTVEPTSGTTATPFAFRVAPPTGTVAQNVRVEFGDNSAVDLGPITASTTVTHTYGSAGNYVARAIMTDVSGATTTASLTIAVSAAP
jgi:hypothetical protein